MRAKYSDFKAEDPDVLFKGEVLKKSSALMVFDSMNGYRSVPPSMLTTTGTIMRSSARQHARASVRTPCAAY